LSNRLVAIGAYRVPISVPLPPAEVDNIIVHAGATTDLTGVQLKARWSAQEI
jgi:hypothetical protein